MRNSRTEDRVNDKLDRLVDKFDETVDSTKTNLKGKIDQYAGVGMAGAEAARETLSHLTENISHRVEDAVKIGLDRVKSGSQEARTLVKKYPLYTVAGVVAVSFIAGMIYGKSTSRR